MKKNLLLVSSFISFFLFNLSYLSAQTSPATATWSLLSDQTATVTGGITAGSQALGPSLSGTSYNQTFGVNTGFQKTGTTSFLPSAYSNDVYLQYTVTPSASNYLQINTISMNIVGGGSGNVALAAQYSIDGGTTFSNVGIAANNTYNTSGYNTSSPVGPNYAVTTTDYVRLVNGASTATNYNGSDVLTFSNLAINIAPGQSFLIRLYPYLGPLATGNRHVAQKNVVITGKTAATLTALPLNFLSFNAKLTDGLSKQVKLSWSTTNEVNTQSFSIERKNAGGFVSIGTVASNNTSGINNYSFTDLNPASGVNYYRLKQIDKDGKSSDSKIVQIENKGSVSFSVYPNPTSGNSVTVLHNAAGDNATLKILNLQGQQIALTNISSGSTRSVLDISALAAGYYVVSFLNGSEKSSIKFVKQ